MLGYSLETAVEEANCFIQMLQTQYRDAAMKIQQKAGIFIVLRCLLVLTKDIATTVIMHLLMKAI